MYPKESLEYEKETGRYYVQGKRKKTYIKNISGQTFGRLKALNPLCVRVYRDGSKKVVWMFSCECGKLKELPSSEATSGSTSSCGCLHSETSIKNSLKSRHKIEKADAVFRAIRGSYKSGAKSRNLSFDLSLEDVKNLTQQNCYYCGVPPSKTYSTKKQSVKYNGIDRVDNDEGYSKENVVTCCSVCNHAKATMSQDAFINWAIDVAEHSKTKVSKEANREFSVTNAVLKDLKDREKLGFRKYEHYLSEFSEEDMLKEMYEEIQDALLYLKALHVKRTALYERDGC